jgi:hypothetical protein
VVGGLNVIVFTIILILDLREKKQKKRNAELPPTSASPEFFSSPSIGDGQEKKSPLTDEEDVTPEVKY